MKEEHHAKDENKKISRQENQSHWFGQGRRQKTGTSPYSYEEEHKA
jgi:hypothetical protein